MENSFVLIVLLLASLATGGMIVNWIGLDARCPGFQSLPTLNSISIRIVLLILTCRSWSSVLWQEA